MSDPKGPDFVPGPSMSTGPRETIDLPTSDFPDPASCTCESMGGRFGAHRPDCPVYPLWSVREHLRECVRSAAHSTTLIDVPSGILLRLLDGLDERDAVIAQAAVDARERNDTLQSAVGSLAEATELVTRQNAALRARVERSTPWLVRAWGRLRVSR